MTHDQREAQEYRRMAARHERERPALALLYRNRAWALEHQKSWLEHMKEEVCTTAGR